MSLRGATGAVFRRELQLFAKRKSDWANPLVFFLIVCALFPFAVGSESERLKLIGIGVIFVGALLAASPVAAQPLRPLLKSPLPTWACTCVVALPASRARTRASRAGF